MDESAVNHPIRLRRSTAQAVQVLKIAAMRLGARRSQPLRRFFRPRQPDHVVARVNKLRHNRRTDKTCSAGKKHTHILHCLSFCCAHVLRSCFP